MRRTDCLELLSLLFYVDVSHIHTVVHYQAGLVFAVPIFDLGGLAQVHIAECNLNSGIGVGTLN